MSNEGEVEVVKMSGYKKCKKKLSQNSIKKVTLYNDIKKNVVRS